MQKSKQIIAYLLSLSLFLCCLAIPVLGHATSNNEPGIEIMVARGVTVSLSELSSGELYEFVMVTYNASGEATSLVATLEWNINGNWETYKSISRGGTSNPFVYEYSSKPLRGYYYRLRADVLSSSIGGGTHCSNVIFY